MFIERIGKNPFVHSDDDHVSLWMLRNGHPSRLTAPSMNCMRNGAYTLDSFIDEHRAQLDALVAEYRHVLACQPQPSSTPREGPDVGQLDPEESPHPIKHTVSDGSEQETNESGLPNCTVPARRRVPVDWLAESLATIADLHQPDFKRTIAVQSCAINSGASRCAAMWLIKTLSTLHPGTDVIPQDFAVFRTSARRLVPTTSSGSATS